MRQHKRCFHEEIKKKQPDFKSAWINLHNLNLFSEAICHLVVAMKCFNTDLELYISSLFSKTITVDSRYLEVQGAL